MIPAPPHRRTLPAFIAALALIVALATAAAVATGITHPLDTRGLLLFRDPADLARPIGPAWLPPTARDITALGSNGVLIPLTLAGAFLLTLARRRKPALFLLAAFYGALALDTAAKHLVDRPRPTLVPHAARVFTTSFPSSHATVSAATALALAVIYAQANPGRRPDFTAPAFAATVIAATLVALIGTSRVYLGVHWPTDILAGWALGAAWGALCWLMLG